MSIPEFTEYKSEGNDVVTLVSMNGDKFKVSKDSAKMSNLVSTMIFENEDVDELDDVPLPNVNTETLKKVLQFCNYHIENPMPEIPKPITSSDLQTIVGSSYGTFIQSFQQEELFEIINAANFMDIQSLLDLACAQVATQIRGKTPEEIRATFNIENDFTPEEEEQIRQENSWLNN